MRQFFSSYRKLDKAILNIIIAQFLIQLINVSFIQILLIYMGKIGYTDDVSADIMSYRFLGILLLSLPIGIYLKGRKMKPLFYITSFFTPLLSIFLILSLQYHIYWLIYIIHFCWGISFVCMQVAIIPYLIRNLSAKLRIEALSLSYST